jgi:MoxR-like ATPase
MSPTDQGNPRDRILELRRAMGASVLGQDGALDSLLIALLADGHVLMEGLPGLAKTRTIKSLANCVEAEFRRIQFTPDLLPADVTGTEVLSEGGGELRFRPGPIFGNLVLADEINRAPAKVQSALLEAMEERQVSVAGTTHRLPGLFLVLATQNPIEQEGTYPLPEAQMDRFLMHVKIDYPPKEAELEVMRLVRAEERAAATGAEPPPRLPQQVVLDARAEIRAVGVAETIEHYVLALVRATRNAEGLGDSLPRWIQVGASPRGALALDRASRAHAWLRGRDHVTPDDVRAVVHECLRHRIVLGYEAEADGVSADDVVRELVAQVSLA